MLRNALEWDQNFFQTIKLFEWLQIIHLALDNKKTQQRSLKLMQFTSEFILLLALKM